MASWMRKKLNYVSKASIVYFQNHPEKTGDDKEQAKEIEKAVKSESAKRAMDRRIKIGVQRVSVMLQEGRI